MSDYPALSSKKQYREDSLQRIEVWLSLLEQQLSNLFSAQQPDTIKNTNDQAINRYISLMNNLLASRMKYAEESEQNTERLQRLLQSLSIELMELSTELTKRNEELIKMRAEKQNQVETMTEKQGQLDTQTLRRASSEKEKISF